MNYKLFAGICLAMLLAIGGGFSRASAAVPAKLKIHLTFDHRNAHDSVGKHNGVLLGDNGPLPTFTKGKVGRYALKFSVGPHAKSWYGQYVEFRPYNFGQEFTISLWVKPQKFHPFSGMVPLLTDSNGATKYGLRLFLNTWNPTGATDRTIHVELGNRGQPYDSIGTHPGAFAWDHWCMITVTVDAQSHKVAIYVNGKRKATGGTGAIAYGKPLPRWYLATFPADPWKGRVFLGLMDDVRIYSGALTTRQVQHLYTRSLAKKKPAP
jgi:hypothetical protein